MVNKAVAIGTASILTIGGIGYAVSRKRSKSRKKNNKRKSKHKYNNKNSRSHSKHKQRKPYTAGKRKDTSKRRIRYTKNNQPYVILANGRARFIKKKSVRNSRKRKGGRY